MTQSETCAAEIRQRFLALADGMNEAMLRRWAAVEAQTVGYRGLSLVSRATGISRPTIRKGLRELADGQPLLAGRVRGQGAGRKSLLVRDPGLPAALDQLIEGGRSLAPIRGVPWVPIEVLQRLRTQGHPLSLPSLVRLLHARGLRWNSHRLQQAVTSAELSQCWTYVWARALQFLRCHQPVLLVSVQEAVNAQRGVSAAPTERRRLPDSPPTRVRLAADRAGFDPAEAGVLSVLPSLVPRILRAHRAPMQDLLLLLPPARRQEDAADRHRALRKLAQDLGLRVQLIMLPRGIYQIQPGRASLRCHMEEAAASGRAVTLDLHLLGDGDSWGQTAARVSTAANPAGLVESPSRHPAGADWTMCAWPRAKRRSRAVHT